MEVNNHFFEKMCDKLFLFQYSICNRYRSLAVNSEHLLLVHWAVCTTDLSHYLLEKRHEF